MLYLLEIRIVSVLIFGYKLKYKLLDIDYINVHVRIP